MLIRIAKCQIDFNSISYICTLLFSRYSLHLSNIAYQLNIRGLYIDYNLSDRKMLLHDCVRDDYDRLLICLL